MIEEIEIIEGEIQTTEEKLEVLRKKINEVIKIQNERRKRKR